MYHRQLVVDDVNRDDISRLGFFADNKFRHFVKNLALNQTLERSGAVVWIISFFCQKERACSVILRFMPLPANRLAVSST